MSVKERIYAIRLAEKLDQNQKFAKELGVTSELKKVTETVKQAYKEVHENKI